MLGIWLCEVVECDVCRLEFPGQTGSLLGTVGLVKAWFQG